MSCNKTCTSKPSTGKSMCIVSNKMVFLSENVIWKQNLNKKIK